MPHKANPARSVLIAAASRQVPAYAAVLLGSLAAEDERPAGAWHVEWQPLREALRLVGGAAAPAAELTESFRVFPDRMRANLDLTGGLIVSERLAAALAPLLGRAGARTAVSRAGRRATESGEALADALAADSAIEAAVTAVTAATARAGTPAAWLRGLADPTAYLGSAPALTDRAPAAHRDCASADAAAGRSVSRRATARSTAARAADGGPVRLRREHAHGGAATGGHRGRRGGHVRGLAGSQAQGTG
ncbi:hypothetical protein [Streptomyces sp. H27-D2]|uniref:hypothetical protein n=1 Tax=Streptomyces sp. H27-D2 TaxID=3046304 RepID=UPI002DB5E9C9|nr:hypothetical protein [Streptomyces sp. H27-D2]MEC4019973.1 hypothetical protein [Streptomyces sp. H27-D2]